MFTGYRIGPAEIEETLLRHSAVNNAAVIGVPDPAGVRGEIVKAFIVLQPTAIGDYRQQSSTDASISDAVIKQHLATTISAYVKTKLAAHEFPREIEFVDSLPQTTTGKIIRADLKKLEAERRQRKADAAV